MTRPKPWHIAQIKKGKEIPHSSYTSKTKLLFALLNILSGKESFIVTIPHWKKFLIYKGELPEVTGVKEITQGGTIESNS
jgi:hypothetical protein